MLWLWNFFLEKRQFSYVLLVALMVAGLFALLQIPKENYPQITIPVGFVVVTLPGASAADMETLVTDKLENQISGISNIDKMTSMSGDGISEVSVQFVASADLNQSIQDLRDAVSRAVPDLPSDASSPQVVKVNFNDMPIVVASIAGDLPPTEFAALGTQLKNELTNISGVSKVDVAGVPPREVDVVVRQAALAQYGLTLPGVVAAISQANASLPAGSITMQGVNYAVNFKGGITDPGEIANIAVGQKSGSPIYLRDIALISNGLAPASTYSRLSVNGAPSQQAITLTVYKQSSAGIAATADAVREKLTELQATSLKGLELFIPPTTDAGSQVSQQLGDLTETGVITVLLVMAVLLLTIGWRESIVAALSIPISFLIAFLALYLTGNTLNFISLFALILAVGILVDSGIVVTEAIHARMRHHKTPLDAARAALHDYAWPLIAGTMTTVAVFAPLFSLSGIIGQFIRSIPFTVIGILIASLIVSLGFIPLIAAPFAKKAAQSGESFRDRLVERVRNWYRAYLTQFLEGKNAAPILLTVLGFMLIGALSLPAIGAIQTVFFEDDNSDNIFVEIEMPQGSTLAQTDLESRKIEEILYAEPASESFVTTIGQSNEFDGQNGAQVDTKLANMFIDLRKDRTDETQTEDPQRIIDEVWSGVDTQRTQAHRITDRREAIAFLLRSAQPGDSVALCGMGACQTMQTQTGLIPWDEREIAREELRKAGYTK
jgi:multidrug efflux pump subunit AcrB